MEWRMDGGSNPNRWRPLAPNVSFQKQRQSGPKPGVKKSRVKQLHL